MMYIHYGAQWLTLYAVAFEIIGSRYFYYIPFSIYHCSKMTENNKLFLQKRETLL